MQWLAKALDGDEDAKQYCAQYSQPIIERELSTWVNKPEVQKRVAALGQTNGDRCAPYDERAHHQKEVLKLPLLPTTTIGSFPQTSEVRQTRAAYKRNDIDFSSYQTAMHAFIKDTVERQEATGLDVLVHGEAERNDMVEYFAENLSGFQTTQFGVSLREDSLT